MLLLFILYFLTGVLAGTLSGLFGIGGGIVVVPALALLFQHEHMTPSLVMHMAVGTSLASIVVTTSRSLIGHLRRHIPFWSIYRKFSIGIIIGTIGGAVLAHFLKSQTLSIIFAIVVLLFGIKMFFQKSTTQPSHRLPGRFGCSVMGLIIGGKSGLLGLGGGTFSIPFLTHHHVSMRQAVVVSSAIGLTIAIVGAVSFALTGMHAVGLPAWSTGYIHWPAWLGIVVGSLCFVPLGVMLSHRLPMPMLRRAFATFLLIVGVKMLFIIW